jgi:nuclear cap-binding protein subunit 2
MTWGSHLHPFYALLTLSQNKRRRSEKDHRDDDEAGGQPEQQPEDPLKDATTLYVGNL